MRRLIRPAAIADLADVERLVRDAYGKYVERIGKPPGPMLNDYRRRIRAHEVWVMADGDELIGVVVLVPADDYLLLDNVAVDPSSEKQGIGKALIEFAEQEAWRRGYGEVRLYTHQEMHENIAMYPRLGYRETGRGEEAGFARVFFAKSMVGGEPSLR